MTNRKKYFIVGGITVVIVGILTAITISINEPTEEKITQSKVEEAVEEKVAVEDEKEMKPAPTKEEESEVETKEESSADAPEEAVEESEDDFTFEEVEESTLDESVVPKAKNTEDSARTQIDTAIKQYVTMYVEGDIEQLEEVVHPTAPFYEMQYITMEEANMEGVKMTLVDYKIKDIKAFDGQMYHVLVEESFKIKAPSAKEETKNQTMMYTMQLIDGDFYIIDGSEE